MPALVDVGGEGGKEVRKIQWWEITPLGEVRNPEGQKPIRSIKSHRGYLTGDEQQRKEDYGRLSSNL